jgi:hypothetical protein
VAEIAAYGTDIALAGSLGEVEIVELLPTILDEEKETDLKLTEVTKTSCQRRCRKRKGLRKMKNRPTVSGRRVQNPDRRGWPGRDSGKPNDAAGRGFESIGRDRARCASARLRSPSPALLSSVCPGGAIRPATSDNPRLLSVSGLRPITLREAFWRI